MPGPSSSLRSAGLYVVPVVLAVVGMSFADGRLTPAVLFHLGLLFPLLVLAIKGLKAHRSPSVEGRSTTDFLLYAILEGLVVASAMSLFQGLLPDDRQSTLLAALRGFCLSAFIVAAGSFVTAVWERKKLLRR